MANETQLRPSGNNVPSENALLTEYQALQSDINSAGSTYWTMASIFIGVSTVLLAGLVGSVLSNEELFNLIFSSRSTELPEILILCTIVTVIGAAVITVFCFLRLWLRRVGFLQQIDFERMRDIERDLCMWAHWRVHGIDHWVNNNFENEIKCEDRTRLLNYQPPNYQQTKNLPQQFWRHWRDPRRYERPSGWHYDWIFGAIIFLWMFVILCFWFFTGFKLLFCVLCQIHFFPLFGLLYTILLAVILAALLALVLVWRTKA